MLTGVARQLVQQLSGLATNEQDLAGGNAENPEGFFESQLLINTNNHLLGLVNASWDRPFLARPVWKNPQLLGETVELREHFRAYWQEPWIDKDPRLCLTWGAYKHILLRRPNGIAIVRNPLNVAASLELRNGFSPSKSALIWWLYYYHLLRSADSSHLLTVCDSEVMHAAPNCMGAIAGFLKGHRVVPEHISLDECVNSLTNILAVRCKPEWRRAQAMEPEPGSLLEKAFRHWQSWQASACSDNVWREGFEQIPSQVFDDYEQELGQGLTGSHPPMTCSFLQRCDPKQFPCISANGEISEGNLAIALTRQTSNSRKHKLRALGRHAQSWLKSRIGRLTRSRNGSVHPQA